MKIVALSDTHGRHGFIEYLFGTPEGDVLIHAGDALNYGTVDEYADFLEWMGSKNHPHKIYVPGNHDGIVYEQPSLCKEMAKEHGVDLLIDEEISIDGFRIYGTPWTKEFCGWWFMKEDTPDGLGRVFNGIPENVDLLVAHGPPYGVLDESIKGVLCGSQELLKTIELKKPKNLFCGHIHEARENPFDTINETRCYNVSMLNRFYEPVYKPLVFNF